MERDRDARNSRVVLGEERQGLPHHVHLLCSVCSVSAEVQAWEFMAFCFSLPAGDVSLHLTTFSLQYTPPVVACVCIHLACKWSNWEIPVSTDGKHWWEYVDGTVTLELLDGKFWSEVPLQRLLRYFGISVPGSAIQTRPPASSWTPGLQVLPRFPEQQQLYGTTEMAKGTQ